MAMERVFKVAEEVYVGQYAARDEMHPTRVVTDTYVMDFRDEGYREENVGHNHYAYGLDLGPAQAQAKFEAYERRQAARAAR